MPRVLAGARPAWKSSRAMCFDRKYAQSRISMRLSKYSRRFRRNEFSEPFFYRFALRPTTSKRIIRNLHECLTIRFVRGCGG
jgi:hypothetical protein